MKYRTYVLFLLLGSVLFIEIFLRFKGGQNTYAESIGQKYSSYYNVVLPTWYHTWTPGDSFLLDHGDFRFPYKINSLGLREKELDKNRPDSVFRIITLGDSYTEGVGAPYDSTWPRLLQKYIVSAKTIQIINGGESGSDPFYDYTFYRDKLFSYEHDMVIASINFSDFTDYVLRGGLQRFHADGTTHFRSGPWFEPFYKHSHLFRAIIQRIKKYPYKGIFVTAPELKMLTDEAVLSYVALQDSFNRIAMKESAVFVLLVYPTPSEIVFDNETNTMNENAMNKICEELGIRGIHSINMWSDFKKEFTPRSELSYTYKNDKHFNAHGYNIMARLVADTLSRRGLLKF